MKSYIISGGRPLYGETDIGGSKNSAVAVLIAALAVGEKVTLSGIPNISDVLDCISILKLLGCSVDITEKNTLNIDSSHAFPADIPKELSERMRASIYLMGAMLSRFGYCGKLTSGGCDFGTRPINYHLYALKRLGAKCESDNGAVEISAPNGLKGALIEFPQITVGGTINAIIAAVRAEGLTVIKKAAKEPHVSDLAEFLNACGADIRGIGSDEIRIYGVKKLHGAAFKIRSDMIEAGTYLSMGLACGGKIRCNNAPITELDAVLKVLKNMGATTEINGTSITAYSHKLAPTDITTAPYPSFPTDLHPPFAVLLSRASGISHIRESVFEYRFRYLDPLSKFGLKTEVDNGVLRINGGSELFACRAACTDLRGGAALVSAALCSEGESRIENTHYIARGYEDMPKKLSRLGADIRESE